MKIFLQGLIAAGLMLWLLISSLDLIGQSFIKDAVELHGTRMLGSDIVFSDSSISLADKTVSLHDACFPAVANPSVFCAFAPTKFLLDKCSLVKRIPKLILAPEVVKLL